MPYYSMSELKEKSKTREKVREMELVTDVVKRIWIPTDKFFYKRIHFQIKTLVRFKNARNNVLDCLNQELGEKGKGCPVCEEVDKLWEMWRGISFPKDKEKEKAEKKKLTDTINRMTGEYFYANAIDVDSEKQFFEVIFFTPPKMMEIEKIISKKGISNVIWLYKKSEKSKKVSYSLIESFDSSITGPLKEEMEELLARSYDNGGPIDLEKSYSYDNNPEDYKKRLGLNVDEEEETPHEQPPATEVDESESLSLEEATTEKPPAKKDPPKKAEEKPPAKKETAKKPADTDLDLDNLNLEDIDSPGELDLNVEEEKLIKVTAPEINTRQKEQDFVKAVGKFLHKNKFITEDPAGDYVVLLKACFKYVKSVGSVEIPESFFR